MITAYLTEPQYLRTGGTFIPSLTARNVVAGDSSFLMAGLPRFRESELQSVMDALKAKYPALYQEQMQQALTDGDMAVFTQHWNALVSAKEESFRDAQMRIALDLRLSPVRDAVFTAQGFDWTSTETRQEILWALATTTPNTDAITGVLSVISASLNDDISDSDLLANLIEDDRLIALLVVRQTSIWPDASDAARQQWYGSVRSVLLTLQHKAELEESGQDQPSSADTDLLFSSDITFSSQFFSGRGVMPHLLYTPSTADGTKQLPLIVWLHGSGERGVSQGTFRNAGLPAVLEKWKLEGFNAYVVCPQLKDWGGSWNNSDTMHSIKNLISNLSDKYSIDPNRIYITGHSLGAQGALYMAARMPDTFAAAVVLSGYHPRVDLESITIPTITYVGTVLSKENGGCIDFTNDYFIPTFGYSCVTWVEASHGQVPSVAFNLDRNRNGRSDLLEWLLTKSRS